MTLFIVSAVGLLVACLLAWLGLQERELTSTREHDARHEAVGLDDDTLPVHSRPMHPGGAA